jgi:hypothetical protein
MIEVNILWSHIFFILFHLLAHIAYFIRIDSYNNLQVQIGSIDIF